jgi:type II secretory pathway component PulF
MPQFKYTARNKAGQKQEGVVEATDRRAVLVLLERQGLTPSSVVESAAASAAASSGGKPAALGQRFTLWTGRRQRMGTREVLMFTTELSDLLGAGMSLGNALNTLANRKTGRAGDAIIASLRDEILRGASLSDAVSQHPESFSRLYASLIKAGEASGSLPVVLKRLVEHYERMQEAKEKIVMALVYPAIVLVLGSATLVFSMVYVIPKFQQVFDQMRATLPLPTRMLIGASRFIAHYGWAVIIGIVMVAAMAHRAVKTPHGRIWWHGLQLRIPLVRGVVASGTFATFARTLQTLLANGVPVLQALNIVEQTVGNAVIASEVRKAKERVTDGTTISGPLAAGKVFPPMMTDMLAIGEQTGDVPTALGHIAARYENELNRNLKIFTTALEPILIVFVAIMVGFVAVSILMAVFNLTNGLGV